MAQLPIRPLVKDRYGLQKGRRFLNDPEVRAIVLDIDSPGGSTYGVSELANEIMAARGKKPVLAVANSLAASAAFWITLAGRP